MYKKGEHIMKHLSQRILAEVIKTQRNNLGLTQEQVSERTGINRVMVGKIEREDYIPSIPQLESLSELLQFDIDQIFVDELKRTVYTAFRGDNLTTEEQDGINHLFEMMVAVKKQIMIRKALENE